jgi:hypothetical protein
MVATVRSGPGRTVVVLKAKGRTGTICSHRQRERRPSRAPPEVIGDGASAALTVDTLSQKNLHTRYGQV